MSPNLNATSAMIYRFATRRRGLASPRGGNVQVVTLRPVPSLPDAACCIGATYHDDAIAEKARSRKS